jgi:ferric-dicitrate binding protein FerR (iron transport regulator)
MKMKDTDKYSKKELEEVASNFDGGINVNDAWDKLYKRISKEEPVIKTINLPVRRTMFLKIAAAALVVIGIASALFYISNRISDRTMVTVTSGNDERNREVFLPDGSKVWLNRNSQLSYASAFGPESRNVKLRGEAFFDITRDPSKPFIIDAGKAKIKVLGTSFNVITDNSRNEVEVFVRTGKVLLSDISGEESIILEPGYVGTTGTNYAGRVINENRNYLSWKTDTLVYNGESLDVVFSDLKKVFNINISTSDPSIANKSLTTTFFSLPEETIIQLICNTFSLSYTKEGDVYHLSK